MATDAAAVSAAAREFASAVPDAAYSAAALQVGCLSRTPNPESEPRIPTSSYFYDTNRIRPEPEHRAC